MIRSGAKLGGIVIDVTNALIAEGVGPRIAIALSVPLLGIGALLLRPVQEPHRSGDTAVPASG